MELVQILADDMERGFICATVYMNITNHVMHSNVKI